MLNFQLFFLVRINWISHGSLLRILHIGYLLSDILFIYFVPLLWKVKNNINKKTISFCIKMMPFLTVLLHQGNVGEVYSTMHFRSNWLKVNQYQPLNGHENLSIKSQKKNYFRKSTSYSLNENNSYLFHLVTPFSYVNSKTYLSYISRFIFFCLNYDNWLNMGLTNAIMLQ